MCTNHADSMSNMVVNLAILKIFQILPELTGEFVKVVLNLTRSGVVCKEHVEFTVTSFCSTTKAAKVMDNNRAGGTRAGAALVTGVPGVRARGRAVEVLDMDRGHRAMDSGDPTAAHKAQTEQLRTMAFHFHCHVLTIV